MKARKLRFFAVFTVACALLLVYSGCSVAPTNGAAAESPVGVNVGAIECATNQCQGAAAGSECARLGYPCSRCMGGRWYCDRACCVAIRVEAKPR
jgi:hypothetical protein